MTLSYSYLTPFIKGFLLSARLVMVIGPQNTFVLRHSLSGHLNLKFQALLSKEPL
jgi:arginine exporter protein ArgO